MALWLIETLFAGLMEMGMHQCFLFLVISTYLCSEWANSSCVVLICYYVLHFIIWKNDAWLKDEGWKSCIRMSICWDISIEARRVPWSCQIPQGKELIQDFINTSYDKITDWYLTSTYTDYLFGDWRHERNVRDLGRNDFLPTLQMEGDRYFSRNERR